MLTAVNLHKTYRKDAILTPVLRGLDLDATARAVITRPRVLLADDPTGNLDEDTGREIVCLLHDLTRQDGLTIVMVTHNREIAAGTDRVVRLAAGRVESPIALSSPLLAET